MQLRFFLVINEMAGERLVFAEGASYLERCQHILNQRYRELELIVKKASDVSPGILPVVVCGEDFFDGANVATHREVAEKTGKCMDRNLAFHFFQHQMTELSSRYPNVLIIPGSVYLSVDAAENDFLTYKQEGEVIRKAVLYAQNVMPVFYAGNWMRLIKKGDYLTFPAVKSVAKTEQDVVALNEKSRDSKLNAVIPKYAEDSLTDISKGLVFFGATPLSGEAAMLKEFKLDLAHFYDPVIHVAGLNVGLEICGDHHSRRLDTFLASHPSRIDVHVVSSCGIGNIYNAGLLRVQADAESKNLTTITGDIHAVNVHTAFDMNGVRVSEMIPVEVDAVNADQLTARNPDAESTSWSPQRRR